MQSNLSKMLTSNKRYVDATQENEKAHKNLQKLRTYNKFTKDIMMLHI